MDDRDLGKSPAGDELFDGDMWYSISHRKDGRRRNVIEKKY